MTDSGHTHEKVCARDIVAHSDAELNRYLDEHRPDGGAIDLDVDDPGNLPESFI
ncbi:uncharacterized protein THITE_2123116 [Thermothielavioides terrestris NRRL 8126]|uniref:Uncharacterized protein n=1 Tax=Thermothielavioides terrestris (strain ATCC 38088 / NRRL 8126) TaxID=578455 RepID=G2RGQ8_THETT|nr:uncharacterized protein THITE_2123116 [Thermothielavioides terrestris NRRL 8126]AEO71090.1 hypothetical protein THITE_2123116 [Thermothielavioides terrestris NRRL 8126]